MRRILATLCAATLVACASTAPRYEADPAVDLAALKRFAWSDAARATEPAHPLDSEILAKRIRAAGTEALLGRGFLADELAPQFRLRSKLLVSPKAKAAPRLSVGIGVGSFGGRSASSVSVGGSTAVGEAVDGLTLAIEVRDAATGELVWQGWREVDATIGDAAEPTLDRTVREILADFPAPAGKPARAKR